MTRIKWGHVLDVARGVVNSYDTPVTLRQLFYRLAAIDVLPSTGTAYKGLSRVTAQARRERTFPDLEDRGRGVVGYRTYTSPQEALWATARSYRRDRTEGQPVSIYLGVEKAGIVNQLDAWFGQPYGLPILPLGGYASQSFVDEVIRDVEAQGRSAVLLYAGDHNPTGWDIPRDFEERTGCWWQIQRVAVNPEQIDAYQLLASIDPEKDAKDSRARAFIARFGRRRVDVDALDPADLRQLFQAAIDEYWDTSAYEAVMAEEAQERAALVALAQGWQG